MSDPVVYSSEQVAIPPEILGDVELAFLMDKLRSVNLEPPASALDLTEYFAHQVAAAPANLLRHTQRIFFHFKSDDGQGLYSALLDLFLALKDKGTALRERLLGGSRSKLSSEQYEALSRFICEPITETSLPKGRLSVLSIGMTGTLPIIGEAGRDASGVRDPLVEAREYIEYFQLDEARTLLENAVLDDPQRDDLQQELLSLYLATNDMNRLRDTRRKLAELIDPLPDYWLAFEGQLDGAETP